MLACNWHGTGHFTNRSNKISRKRAGKKGLEIKTEDLRAGIVFVESAGVYISQLV